MIPIATLEYVISAAVFGAPETAALFGRLALDFQTSLEKSDVELFGFPLQPMDGRRRDQDGLALLTNASWPSAGRLQ